VQYCHQKQIVHRDLKVRAIISSIVLICCIWSNWCLNLSNCCRYCEIFILCTQECSCLATTYWKSPTHFTWLCRRHPNLRILFPCCCWQPGTENVDMHRRGIAMDESQLATAEPIKDWSGLGRIISSPTPDPVRSSSCRKRLLTSDLRSTWSRRVSWFKHQHEEAHQHEC
jgi:hypothetical protein